MNERRKFTWLKTLKGAAIIYGTAPPAECLIRNLSPKEASLEIKSHEPIPEHFAILIKPELVRRNCRLI